MDPEEGYSALELLDRARAALPSSTSLSMNKLMRFRLDPAFQLSIDDQRVLFSDPLSRSRWRMIKQELPMGRSEQTRTADWLFTSVPNLAAASTDDGPIYVRRLELGTIFVYVRDDERDEAFLVVVMDSDSFEGAEIILLIDNEDQVGKYFIGRIEEDRRAQLRLDLTAEVDAKLLALITNDAAIGELAISMAGQRE